MMILLHQRRGFKIYSLKSRQNKRENNSDMLTIDGLRRRVRGKELYLFDVFDSSEILDRFDSGYSC